MRKREHLKEKFLPIFLYFKKFNVGFMKNVPPGNFRLVLVNLLIKKVRAKIQRLYSDYMGGLVYENVLLARVVSHFNYVRLTSIRHDTKEVK